MHTIPMWSRASDIRTLALGSGCQAQWGLSHLYANELPDAVWFILGTSIHTAIEETILNSLPLDDMIAVAMTDKHMMMAEAAEHGVIEQASPRAKRDLATIELDIERMCGKWWHDVYPESPTRQKIYDQYDWPPATEYEINTGEGDLTLRTTVDAIFNGKGGGLIVDWKSGSTKKSHESQIQIYAYGLSRFGLFDTSQDILGAFHHIDHSAQQWVEGYWGDEAIEAAIRSTHEQKEGILERRELVYNPDWWCNYCVARGVCPVKGDGAMADVKRRLNETEGAYQ